MATFAVTILADTLEQVSRLRGRGLDLHERAARRRPDSVEFAIPGVLTDEQIARLRAEGYRVDVHEDADQTAVERAAEVRPDVDRFAPGPGGRAESTDRGGDHPEPPIRGLERLMDLSDVTDGDSGGGDADGGDANGGDLHGGDPEGGGPAVARSRGGERTVLGGYLTPDEVESALQALAASHPGVAAVTSLPERSWAGRTSHVLRLRAGPRPDRPGILLTGGVHAREWGGSDICVAFATNLLRSYADGTPLRYGRKTFSAADVRAILDNTEILVAADVNPDGKAHSQSADPGRPQNFWWRKNRRTAGMPAGTVGVDVNRNFDFLWASGIGTESDPAQITYKGPAVFSEPESRNLRWLYDTHQNIGYFVDVHSFGGLILYSWGDDENQVDQPAQNFLNPTFDGRRGVVGDSRYREFIRSEDQAALVELASAMNTSLSEVRGRRYAVDQAVGLYPTSATSDDYAFSRHRVSSAYGKVYGFTIEFGQQFVPPYREMRAVMADVAAGLTELCRRAVTAGNVPNPYPTLRAGA